MTEFKFKYSEFVAYSEIIPAGKSITKAYGEEDKIPSRSGTFSFTETKSFEEALSLATDGWDVGLSELPQEKPTEVESGIEIHQDVEGSSVHIGNFLEGRPDNMNRVESKIEWEYPPLTIYINLTYSWAIKAKTALKHCADIIDLVNELQTRNNIKIVGVFETDQRRSNAHRIDVIIKDFDERFVINNIAFAFHPSFYRRLYFAALEHHDFIDTDGYGKVAGDNKVQERSFKDHDGFGKAAYLPSVHHVNTSADYKTQLRWKEEN